MPHSLRRCSLQKAAYNGASPRSQGLPAGRDETVARKQRDRQVEPNPAEAASASGSSAGARFPAWSLGVLIASVLAASFLRLKSLGAASLWSDELVSWWAVSAESLGDVISRSTSCMATPSLSFLVEYLSVGLGGASEWSLRLPSALAGIATVVVIFFAGRRMFGPATGATAAALLAIHPVHLWFSADARPYALAMLLAAGSTWAVSELLRSASWLSVAAYAVLTAALLHTQFIFLPFVLAQVIVLGLALAGRAGATVPAPARVGAALGGAALLSLPVLPQLLGIAGRAKSLTWSFPGDLPPGVFSFFQTTPLAVALLLAFGAWMVVWPKGERFLARHEARQNPDLLALLLGFLVPSLLLTFGALALELPTLAKPRYLSASLVPCVLLVAWLLTRPAWKTGRWLLIAAYLALVFAGKVGGPLSRGESFNGNANQEDWRGVGQILQEEVEAADLVLFRSGLVEVDDHYQGEFPAECASYLVAPLGNFYLPSQPPMILLPQEFDPASNPEAYRRHIGQHLVGKSRIWFVMANPPNPPAYYQSVVRYLQEVTGLRFRLGRTGNFEYRGQVTLALFEAIP